MKSRGVCIVLISKSPHTAAVIRHVILLRTLQSAVRLFSPGPGRWVHLKHTSLCHEEVRWNGVLHALEVFRWYTINADKTQPAAMKQAVSLSSRDALGAETWCRWSTNHPEMLGNRLVHVDRGIKHVTQIVHGKWYTVRTIVKPHESISFMNGQLTVNFSLSWTNDLNFEDRQLFLFNAQVNNF